MRTIFIVSILILGMTSSVHSLNYPRSFYEEDWIRGVIAHFFDAGLLDGYSGAFAYEDAEVIGELSAWNLEEVSHYVAVNTNWTETEENELIYGMLKGLQAESTSRYELEREIEREFSVVEGGHWSYKALAHLQQTSEWLQGYPAGFFDGSNELKRYDFAQAIARTLDSMDSEDVGSDDCRLILVNALREEYSGELAALGRLWTF